MDEDQTLWGQCLNLIAVPAGLLLLVPLALLFVIWFYLAALAEGARLLVRAPFRKTGLAQATPLHSRASTPALFQPGVGQAGASARRSG